MFLNLNYNILKTFFTKNNNIYETSPDIKGVVTQPIEICPKILKFIFLGLLINPTPITAPTIICELDTGTNGIAGSPIETKKFDKLDDEKINKTIA